ncbi:cytochrome P450 94A2-like [Capsicum annuum]|uniref:cytochrome P450 94A2-like n=1 Tax=Capsicum annuum TaxID=4072 RepID=UPI001FB17F77|nr:cytochrome P450 94A2-like [Capsicum annuum]
MGRSQELWGSDWADFRPERWLERRRNDTSSGDDWNFIARDPFTYPVFQAGPRTCLGKEIAVVLMKMVVATILKRFRVTPAQDNFSPHYNSIIVSRMKNGFPHILKTRFNNYHKERIFIEALSDLFRKGLFLSDGSEWKSQRQFFHHNFDPKEFHAYTFVVEEELSGHLVPFLSNAEKTASTIDLQDTFRRFTFDFVCGIGFGFDPEYLLPSLPPIPFADAFKTAVKLSILRKERFVAEEDLEDKDIFARIVRRAQGEQLDKTFLVNTVVS